MVMQVVGIMTITESRDETKDKKHFNQVETA